MRTLRLYTLGMRLLPHTPRWLISAVCELLGALALLHPGLRRAVRSNLRRVAPRRSWLPLAQQVVANVCRHYAELLTLPSLSKEQLLARFDMVGLQQVLAAQERGGAILAVPHCGSYSLVLAALAASGVRITLIVERVEPPELQELLSTLRASHGVKVVGLGADAGREVLRALRRKEIVVLAADRDLASQHTQLPFFGAPAAVPAGPGVLAARGVPVITAFTAHNPSGRAIALVQQLDGGGDDPQLWSRLILAQLEEYIGRFPESWGVLQPVWGASSAPLDPLPAEQGKRLG